MAQYTSDRKMHDRPELVFVVFSAVALNLSGAIIAKLLASTLGDWRRFAVLGMTLGAVYALRTLYWVVVGRRWQLSFLYPVLSISYLASFLIGVIAFGEAFIWRRLVGSCIIVLGVVICSTSAQRFEGQVQR